MNQLLVFNHHSLPFNSKEKAFSAIPEFLKICLRANNLGLSTILIDDNVDRNWFRLQLAEGYYWQDWYNQNNNDQNKDLIRAFRSIKTRQPFFSSNDIVEGLELFEVKLNAKDYSAFQAAVWHESPVTSFPTRVPWNTSPIPVEVNEINKDGKLISNKSEIDNIYSMSIIDMLEPDLLNNRKESIQSGKEILERKKEICPLVDFCGKTQEHLLSGSFSKTILEQVKDSITGLNSFCEKWNAGIFENYSHENLRKAGLNHNVSGESPTVLQNPALRSEREFWLPDGSKELFENHIKIAKGIRIHFYPDPENKKIYVGYIGSHLRLK
ncbi:MAG TPA: hypothetical protein DCO75_04915 [Fibrobacteres bacterium]|jgi:hypothetical protein|nr:hypothetical protein [Fibrobacterota bacterium]